MWILLVIIAGIQVAWNFSICLIVSVRFWALILKESMSLWDMIVNIFSFSQYSWYVFMYVGLFSLIPYLNLLWNRLNNRRDKLILAAFLCFLAALTSIVNLKGTIIPENWTGIYPVAYYYLGALISEEYENIKIKNGILFTAWSLLALIFGMINYILSRKELFAMGSWNDFGSFESMVLSSLIFISVLRLDTGNMKTGWKIILKKMSNLVYAAFMLSYISDIAAWKIFKDIIPINDKLLKYFPVVILSFASALVMSWIFNNIYGMIRKKSVK